MSSTIREIACRTIAISAITTLALASAAASAATSEELEELSLRAWNGEPELLSEVYAPEGVHTATFYDRTNEYVGPADIARVAGRAPIERVGPHIPIPAADGELRWASFATLGGGTACLFHAADDRIVRHDCVLPEHSYGGRRPAGPADAEDSAAIDAIMEALDESWGRGTSVEQLAEVYAPEAVHSARYLDRTRTYTGPEEIYTVARSGGTIAPIGERVDFEAPDGELAWAGVSDIAGGTICLFRAVDGMVTRHDCVLPISG
jgi:hypothetical protein